MFLFTRFKTSLNASHLSSLGACFLLSSSALAEQFMLIPRKEDKCINHYSINEQDGSLSFLKKTDLPAGPGGLSLSPDNTKAVCTLSGKTNIHLATYSLVKNASLTKITEEKIPNGGSGTFSKNGKFYAKYVYGQNLVSVLEMNNAVHTGNITSEENTASHPHDIGVSNCGTFLFVPHNRSNRLYQFKFGKENGKLMPMTPAYLEGPDFATVGYSAYRSLAFHPQQNVVYCSFEKGGGVASLKVDTKGIHKWQDFPSVKKGSFALPSTIALSPDSKFLFVSNRGVRGNSSSIASFQLNPEGKIVERIGVYENPAKGPRNIVIERTGKFLYTSSVKTDTLMQFGIEQDGSLKFLKEHKIGAGPMLVIDQ